MKKVIRLTEEDIRGIVMNILMERHGVPDNITKVASEIYNSIMAHFPSEYELNTNNEEYDITFYGNYLVGDMKFDTVNFKIKMEDTGIPDLRPTLAGASVMGPATVEGDRVVKETNTDFVVILRIAVGRQWNFGMILDLIKTDRTKIESMITHELMHKFEHYKKPENYVGQSASYNAYQQVGINNVRPINEFFHLLYFVHETERRTRSSEFYSQLKSENITKERFKEFFNESEMIKTLKVCRDYTFKKLFLELHGYMDGINTFLEGVKDHITEPVDLNGSDAYKIHLTLKLTHKMITNAKIDIFSEILKSTLNPFQLLFDSDGMEDELRQKQGFMDNFVKQSRKYENYQDFFGNEIKRLNFVGDKTIRRLSNLYDMLDNENNSIVNWDLHQKINKVAEKTKSKLNELLSDEPPSIIKKKEEKG